MNQKLVNKEMSTILDLFSNFDELRWTEDQILINLPSKWEVSIGVFDNNQLVAFSFNSVKTDILYIHALFISEEYRSTGLSHKMMTEMNSIMKSLNLNKIGLKVGFRNTQALRFYLSEGFEIIDIGSPDDRLLMEK